MPPEIRRLSKEWLSAPIHVEVAPVATAAELVEQTVHFVEPREKLNKLQDFLENTAWTRTIVFSRTKHGADKIVKQLSRAGLRAAALHSNKSQSVRQRTLAQFKGDRPPVLVATDIAARGLDVDAISHVVNYDLPEVPEVYVHRIGRTGRAGATGAATSFVSAEERNLLRGIERLMNRKLAIEGETPEWMNEPAAKSGHGDSRRRSSRQNGPSQPNNRRRGPGNVPRGASGGKRPRRRQVQGDRPLAAAVQSNGANGANRAVKANGAAKPAAAAQANGGNGAAQQSGSAAPREGGERRRRPKQKRQFVRL
jgi:ATP-dependent RNA helicase RhlE